MWRAKVSKRESQNEKESAVEERERTLTPVTQLPVQPSVAKR